MKIICKFKVLCDMDWDDLTIIDKYPNIKFCSECSKDVHYCSTYDQLQEEIKNGHCVALGEELAGESYKLTGLIISALPFTEDA